MYTVKVTKYLKKNKRNTEKFFNEKNRMATAQSRLKKLVQQLKM